MKQTQQCRPSPGKTVLKITASVLRGVFLFFGVLCFSSATWYIRTYGNTGFDSILFTLTSGVTGANSGLINSYLLGGLLPAVLIFLVLQVVLFFPWNDIALKIKLRGKPRQLYPFPRWLSTTVSLILSLTLFISAGQQVSLFNYLYNLLRTSNLYEDFYQDPGTANITFPEEKRNLIYIMLESMETSYLSQAQGGAMEESLIPELYDLAENNINFSHNGTVGGFREVTGASWTIGAMVAQTGGIPLKTPVDIEDWQNGYGKDGEFLPGAASLSTVLAKNGYNQALMVGSDANFGGRKTYFETHGTENIYDIYTAWEDGIVPKGYFEWWGMEDCYLFDYAKQEITEMAAQDQPFAFTMLTVDTHHIGGYKCQYCDSTYEENYENVIACSSRQVAAFVAWIQAQPFYENTTVIVTGDHCSMDRGYFDRNVDPDYTRHVYNCFLNAPVTPERAKHRQFCAMDMLPTTLAAMGCTIENDRLGLGTNLFSSRPTLIEVFGYSAFTSSLEQSSDYYQRFYKASE